MVNWTKITKLQRNLIVGSVLALVIMTSFNNCSDMSPLSSSDQLASGTSTVAISPANQTISPGSSLQFMGVGGQSPYTFSVVGGGAISTAGLYTAPPSITTPLTVTIYVMDSLGFQSSTTVRVGGGSAAIVVAYTPMPASPGSAITILPSGGTPPYTYALLYGQGSLSGNIYQAPATGETASIQINDSTGQSTLFALPIAGPTNAISGVFVTPYGTHQPNGGTGCPSGYSNVGMVADASYYTTYGASIYGDQLFCTQTVSSVSSSSVLSDLTMTSSNCSAGYTYIGSVENCNGSGCYGAVNFCGLYRTGIGGSVGSTVVGFYVTPEGARSISAPLCGSGYNSIGTTADCAGGQCYGLQSYCVQKQ